MNTRVAVITTASVSRLSHLRRQRRFLREATPPEVDVLRIEAWLDSAPPDPTEGVRSVHVSPGRHGMRVGAARNAAASLALDAEVDLLVFLDVDCLPGDELLPRYLEAAHDDPHAVLAGPVTYLASVQRPATASELRAHARPHPARPLPADDDTRAATADEYDLFWSLSFAVTPQTWARTGGFDEVYEGYGAEDTDLAWRARERAIDLRWVGGAHAYHQWHPTSSPPWAHLDDILRNGASFAERWGSWPMRGWIDAFAAAGAIEPNGTGWRRT